MAYRGLGEYLEKLDALGELRRVRVEVDPALEIAEITDRVSKSPAGGKALLFESVKGSGFPVATNLFGSNRRICVALEIDELDDLTGRMEALLGQLQTSSSAAAFDAMSRLVDLSRYAPEYVTEGACREVVDYYPDLARYPFLRNWSGDGRPGHDGRFITLPLVITADPDSGEANCGMYRVEPFGSDTAGIHWRKTSHGAGHYAKYLEREERMAVAVAIGGDPATIFAASLPLPGNMDEMVLAGIIRREPSRLMRCLTSELMVPADAEMVIEGYLEPGEMRQGGAFGNHTGFYADAAEVPVMHVSCITRRRSMIYPATVVGRPPMEDCYMAKAAERLFLPLLRLKRPEIAAINMPMEGIFHGCAIVALEKRYEDHPREAVEALWEGGWLADSRLLVIVDADTDVNDLSLIAWRVLNIADWRRDLMSDEVERENVPLGRLALDATRKKGPDGRVREEIARERSVTEMVDRRWREYGL